MQYFPITTQVILGTSTSGLDSGVTQRAYDSTGSKVGHRGTRNDHERERVEGSSTMEITLSISTSDEASSADEREASGLDSGATQSLHREGAYRLGSEVDSHWPSMWPTYGIG